MFNFDVNALAEQISPAVQKVAESLGTSAEYLWTIGVQGVWAEGLAKLLIGLLLCILAVVIVVFSKQMINKHAKYGEDIMLGWFLVGIVMVFPCVMGFFLFYDGLVAMIAPEYTLMMKIIETVK